MTCDQSKPHIDLYNLQYIGRKELNSIEYHISQGHCWVLGGIVGTASFKHREDGVGEGAVIPQMFVVSLIRQAPCDWYRSIGR